MLIAPPLLDPKALLKKPDEVPFTKTEKRTNEIQYATHLHHFPKTASLQNIQKEISIEMYT
jgi:hypothetical protein